jgi:hypothetical protein
MHAPDHGSPLDPITDPITRRGFVSLAAAGSIALAAAPTLGQTSREYPGSPDPIDPLDHMPILDPALAREVVGKSHSDFDTVKKLVEARPELAKAAIDWGFGDWESALGAASHTGRRNIAELLLANGARTNLFTAAMLGHLEVVKATIEASPGIQQVLGPHGITLWRHAKAGKEQAAPVLAYLESLGDANSGHTDLPLEQVQIDAICGVYTYGAGSSNRFEIRHERDRICFAKEGKTKRDLYHQGNLGFLPAGAPSVRFVFGIDQGVATSVTIGIAEPPLVALRLG